VRHRVGLLLLVVIVGALATAGFAMAFTPNDADWNFMWPQGRVQMTRAWNLSRGNRHVIEAVVDTGVNPKLRDFKGALVPGKDFVSGGYTKVDDDGHGTELASIIAARGNNGTGIPGYCWGCKVMPVRVADGNPQQGANIPTRLAAAGIRWAADHGAQIITLSFSEAAGEGSDPALAAAIAYASHKGILVLASAGNTSSTGDTYPAADPGAYAVAATTRYDKLSSYSTRGNWIHLAAPGCQLALSQTGVAIEPCGTSLSAPAIAGVAGLMLSVNPSLTPAQIVSILQRTSKPVAGIAGGRINAYGAVRAAAASAAPRAGHPVRLSRFLGSRWNLGLAVQGERVAVTLRSPKAQSCSLSLASSDGVWLTSRRGRAAASLFARISTGKYRLAVSCRLRRLRAASLTLRAFAH
jgi:subtilisin family serine protease